MMTAEQARKLTNDRQKIKMQNELRDVFQMIRATADGGGCCVEFYQSHEVVIYGLIKTYREFLEQIGYKIVAYKDTKSAYSDNVYSISW